MTDREKLMNLICESIQTDRCAGMCNHPHCNMVQALCDHLIANGVTFARDTDVLSWIPVTERLPEKNQQCVCRYVFGDNCDFPFYQVLHYFATVEKPHFQHEGSLGLNVTHWMPLPEPPEEKTE